MLVYYLLQHLGGLFCNRCTRDLELMVGSIFRPYLFLFGGVLDSQRIYICEFMRYYWCYVVPCVPFVWPLLLHFWQGRQFGVTETTTLEDRGMIAYVELIVHSRHRCGFWGIWRGDSMILKVCIKLKMFYTQVMLIVWLFLLDVEAQKVTALQPIKAGAYLVLRASGAVIYLIMSSSMTYVMYFLCSTRR